MTTAAGPAVQAPWALRPWIRASTVGVLLVLAVLATLSAQRTEIDRMLSLSAQAIGSVLGSGQPSQVADGLARIGRDLFPLQLSESTDIGRIEGFDPDALPWGAHVETRTRTERRLDPLTLEMTETSREYQALVQPLGYLGHVLRLMLQTLEIALWGTVVAVLVGAPLALFGARGYSPHPMLYLAARGTASFLRSVPELISALFLVLAFGFGPIAGVLALGLHTAGFLGKFFAEDIENAAKGPQDALRATGAGRLRVLRYAVMPQVIPSYLGYVQYILERNVRTATVIGIVGAGGIGQELKGRFEMFDFPHVSTILLVIFATVLALELATAQVRKRML